MQHPSIKSLTRAVISALALLILHPAIFAQGIVSSGVTGTLLDNEGKPIAGETVEAVHTPTNTRFKAITGPNGRFAFKGLPVGGPYTISAAGAGHQPVELTGIGTTLGEDTDVQLVTKSDVVSLEKFVINASANDLDPNANGASSVLSNRQLAMQPSTSRSFADLMKTNPFVSIRAFPQVQALGMNNRYNSITLDGARINDQFGISSSGLFSLNNPFSIDAIEQFSVSLTPYDVRQSGFAGAAVNAVSKSGTNEFHGSAYYLYTSDQWQGKDLSGSKIGQRSPLIERTIGYTFGGPIIKDRLFFFANFETFKKQTTAAQPGFVPDSTFLSWLDTQIAALPGAPDLGDWGGAGVNSEDDTKRLIKLDWNINRDHRMTVRYSDTEGNRPSFNSFNPGTSFSGSPATLPGAPSSSFSNGVTSLSSSYYNLAVKEKVWAAQLFSNWTPNFKTQLNFSKNTSVSERTSPVSFPEIRIFNVPGNTNATPPVSVTSGTAFSFGTEVSSQGNALNVDSMSYSATADYTWRNFTFSGGFDHEETDFLNLFRQGSYGVFGYTYSPSLNLATATPAGFMRAVVQDGTPLADISRLEQTGVFGQVKWEPTSRFNIMFGLRYDTMGSPIAPTENTDFKTKFGLTNAGTIDGTDYLATRLSFNYALDAKRTTQIRGGIGTFLGRNPWVWISNSYGATGAGRYTLVSSSSSPAPTLTSYLANQFDPDSPIGTSTGTPPASTATINLIQPGLHLPTIMRGNIAIDRKLPGINATISLEYIYNKQLEALFIENLNLKVFNGDTANQPTAASYGADGRLRFATNSSGQGGPSRVPWIAGYSNVLRVRNVRAGESHYVALTLDRPFKDNWAYTLSYTRGRATDAQSFGSSTAGSQWQFNNLFNQGAVEVARSDYEVRDRIQGSISREFRYLKNLKSTISLNYEGRTGQPYSYTYTNDINGDGNSADLVAVPTDASDARFDFSGMSSPQKDAYFAFLSQSGLNRFGGGYAPRNAFTTSWQNRLDLRFVQEIRAVGPVRIEFFADFINFGAWLSKGVFNYVETINSSTTNSNQLRALGSATYTGTGLIKPAVTLDSGGNIVIPGTSQVVINNNDARWRIQGGVRIKF